MITESQVRELVGNLEDPILNVPISETEGILEISIKEEKKHVSVKIAIGREGGQEQLELQMKIVSLLKEEGADSVGLVLKSCRMRQLRNSVQRAEVQWSADLHLVKQNLFQ